MFPPLVLSAVFLAAAPVTGTPAESDLVQYHAEAEAAGVDQNAGAQVRLALWCEAHGMSAERLKHLALAILAEPKNATARALLGLMADEGQWRKPEEVAERVKQDANLAATLAEYNHLRDQTGETEKDQWKLALWCEHHGLQPEALAHFSTVSRLNPKHPDVWKKLGYKKQKNGHWAPAEDIARAKADAEAQKKADIHWLPLVKKWKGLMARPDRRAEAEDHLNAVTDPLALHAIWRAFVTERWADQLAAVQLIGQLKSPAATQGLAYLAIASSSKDVREAATAALRRRDAREYLGMAVDQIRKPLKYEVRKIHRPDGSAEVLFVEGEQYNLRRTFATPSTDTIRFETFLNFVSTYGIDPGILAGNGSGRGKGIDVERSLQKQAREIERETKVLAKEWLRESIAEVEATNVSIHATNALILPFLQTMTGKSFGGDPQVWKDWWTDQQGYAVSPRTSSPQPKPTFDQYVPVAQYVSVPLVLTVHHSCFGAGTLVRTLNGPRPIESIRAGDRVLTQETSTGSLRFVPVLAIFHNQPSATLRLTLEGQTPVVVTGIHRFWNAGNGWVMARDLKPGDRIRTLAGVSAVESVVEDRVQPVFNLEIHGDHDYFVGSVGALVHDNSLVKPTAAPFDASTPLATTGPTVR